MSDQIIVNPVKEHRFRKILITHSLYCDMYFGNGWQKSYSELTCKKPVEPCRSCRFYRVPVEPCRFYFVQLCRASKPNDRVISTKSLLEITFWSIISKAQPSRTTIYQRWKLIYRILSNIDESKLFFELLGTLNLLIGPWALGMVW